jgi:hypothetical protein
LKTVQLYWTDSFRSWEERARRQSWQPCWAIAISLMWIGGRDGGELSGPGLGWGKEVVVNLYSLPLAADCWECVALVLLSRHCRQKRVVTAGDGGGSTAWPGIGVGVCVSWSGERICYHIDVTDASKDKSDTAIFYLLSTVLSLLAGYSASNIDQYASGC